jgi:plastocyanin
MGRHSMSGRLRRPGRITFVCALAAILLIAVFAGSCGGSNSGTTASTGGTATTAGGTGVVMKNLAFDPATVTIKAGESVIWTNLDSVNHTVVADNGEFKSGDLAQKDTFTFKFDKAGTYPFHCSIHPSMKGTVVVQ